MQRCRVGGARLPGLAVAASVATLAILCACSRARCPQTAPLRQRASSAAAAAPISYVVPRALEPRPRMMPATELANYVVAHSEFSTPVSRRNLLSALMASESAAVGAPEQVAGPWPKIRIADADDPP